MGNPKYAFQVCPVTGYCLNPKFWHWWSHSQTNWEWYLRCSCSVDSDHEVVSMSGAMPEIVVPICWIPGWVLWVGKEESIACWCSRLTCWTTFPKLLNLQAWKSVVQKPYLSVNNCRHLAFPASKVDQYSWACYHWSYYWRAKGITDDSNWKKEDLSHLRAWVAQSCHQYFCYKRHGSWMQVARHNLFRDCNEHPPSYSNDLRPMTTSRVRFIYCTFLSLSMHLVLMVWCDLCAVMA